MFEVEKTFLVKIAGMIVGKNREVENCWIIEEKSVTDFVKMVFWTSKGRIGSWTLTELEEQISGGDCMGGSMCN